MVEGVSECYYRVATRQDAEVTAGIRIMDGCGTNTETLRSKVEEHQPYLLYVETSDDAATDDIDDMLEVSKKQENQGG